MLFTRDVQSVLIDPHVLCFSKRTLATCLIVMRKIQRQDSFSLIYSKTHLYGAHESQSAVTGHKYVLRLRDV